MRFLARPAVAVLVVAATGCSTASPSVDPSRTVAPASPAAAGSATAGVCGTQAPPPSPVYAFFRCQGENAGDPTAHPVPRQAQAADPISRLDAAVIGLLGGPTAEESARGYVSWFSEETQLVPVSVDIDDDGLAIVDFGDLRQVIPNASTSAGAAALLAELNATVFQIVEVQAVEYRMDGSCSAFWEWLQSACQVVQRPR